MTDMTLSRRAPAAPTAAPEVEVVVPVYNEQAGLERSIRGLHRYLRSQFPFSWRIVIADNASTDTTPVVAERLSREIGRASCRERVYHPV